MYTRVRGDTAKATDPSQQVAVEMKQATPLPAEAGAAEEKDAAAIAKEKMAQAKQAERLKGRINDRPDFVLNEILEERGSFNPEDYQISKCSLRFKSPRSDSFYNFTKHRSTFLNLSMGFFIASIGTLVGLLLSLHNSNATYINVVFLVFFFIMTIISALLNRRHANALIKSDDTQLSEEERKKALHRSAADIPLVKLVSFIAVLALSIWAYMNLITQLKLSKNCNSAGGSWTVAVFVVPLVMQLAFKMEFIMIILATAVNSLIIGLLETISPTWCLQSATGFSMFLCYLPLMYMVELNERRAFVYLKEKTVLSNSSERNIPTYAKSLSQKVDNNSAEYGLQLLYHVFKRLQVPIDAITAGVDSARFHEDDILGRKADPSGKIPEESPLTSVKKNLIYLNQVVHNVISMSDLDSGLYTLKFVKFNLRNLLEELVKSFKNPVDDQEAFLQLAIAKNIPDDFVGDMDRIKEVLINLLNNALQYSEKGSKIKVNVNQIQDEQLKESLEIKITDGGIGMTTEDRFCLFDPQGQLLLASRNNLSGIGVGLLLCCKIMARHGGVIGVDALEGVGSSFYIRLPYDLKESEDEVKEGEFIDTPSQVNLQTRSNAASVAAVETEKEEKSPDDTPLIIILDDISSSRVHFGRAIASWKWKCNEFKNEKEILNAISSFKTGKDKSYLYSVILISYSLRSSIEKIRESGIRSPIVLSYDKGQDIPRDEMLKYGTRFKVEKNCEKKFLRQALENALLSYVRDDSEYEPSRSEVYRTVKNPTAHGRTH